jgi:transglutaminase-like putative cysteine protease
VDAGIGDTVAGQSHAWVEWWVGDWVGHDPTNGIPIGHRHVLVARGRDYADVTPLKGVYNGPSGSHLGVTVEITRLA